MSMALKPPKRLFFIARPSHPSKMHEKLSYKNNITEIKVTGNDDDMAKALNEEGGF